MKHLALVFLCLPALALAGGRTYNAVGDVTHDCAKEPEATVNASASKIVFTGTCDKVALNGSSLTVTFEGIKRLSVNGSSNTVDGTAIDRLSVNGADNAVTYKKAVSGKKPRVSSTGVGNKIKQVK